MKIFEEGKNIMRDIRTGNLPLSNVPDFVAYLLGKAAKKAAWSFLLVVFGGMIGVLLTLLGFHK